MMTLADWRHFLQVIGELVSGISGALWVVGVISWRR